MRYNQAMNLARGWIGRRIVFKIPDHPFGIEPFTFEELATGMGYDPERVRERNEVYYKVIEYWRKKASQFFDYLLEEGSITGSSEERWNKFLWYYNSYWNAYVFYYDSETKSYCQPGFFEKEIIDQRRVIKQADGFITVLKDMSRYGERLLYTGQDLPRLERTMEALRRRCLMP
jgi:hypothetical protein